MNIKKRLFLILFWIFVFILVASILQNYLLKKALLSNDVFIAMGITVVLVFLDEITKNLNNKSRISKEIEEDMKNKLGNSK